MYIETIIDYLYKYLNIKLTKWDIRKCKKYYLERGICKTNRIKRDSKRDKQITNSYLLYYICWGLSENALTW